MSEQGTSDAGHPAGRGCYVYAVTRGLDVAGHDPVSASGLRGEPVRLVPHAGLQALVSDVDLGEFGEEGMRRNLEDLAWLEEVARTHDAVVASVAERAPTAPLRLGTITYDEDGVRERLTQWHDALVGALDRVEGRAEWSVKAFAPQPGAAVPSQEPAPSTGGAGAGAAYLTRRRAQIQARHEADRGAAELADRLHASLSGHSVASRRLPPQDPRLSGHPRPMTLNAAYLVDRAAGEEFAALAGRLADEHPEAGMVVAGPWPPYSFAVLEEP